MALLKRLLRGGKDIVADGTGTTLRQGDDLPAYIGAEEGMYSEQLQNGVRVVHAPVFGTTNVFSQADGTFSGYSDQGQNSVWFFTVSPGGQCSCNKALTYDSAVVEVETAVQVIGEMAGCINGGQQISLVEEM